jgi:hypothetical protein
MDLLNIITLAILGLITFVVFRKKSDSKDAVNHATVDASLAERQRSKKEELEKMDKALKEIEEELKNKTPDEIEAYWNAKK